MRFLTEKFCMLGMLVVWSASQLVETWMGDDSVLLLGESLLLWKTTKETKTQFWRRETLQVGCRKFWKKEYLGLKRMFEGSIPSLAGANGVYSSLFRAKASGEHSKARETRDAQFLQKVTRFALIGVGPARPRPCKCPPPQIPVSQSPF